MTEDTKIIIKALSPLIAFALFVFAISCIESKPTSHYYTKSGYVVPLENVQESDSSSRYFDNRTGDWIYTYSELQEIKAKKEKEEAEKERKRIDKENEEFNRNLNKLAKKTYKGIRDLKSNLDKWAEE